jgi:uncharacterized OB-fold protein
MAKDDDGMTPEQRLEMVKNWKPLGIPTLTMGWQCPRCGNVYGPNHNECNNCNRYNFTAT